MVKRLTILCDGMADDPIEKLGGKTPLMVAKTPNMDRLAREGACGLFVTIPEDLPPGSEVANLSVLGYDPKENFCQRGVLEAASLGVEIKKGQLALRCNLIYVENDRIVSHSGGDLAHEEAREIVGLLNQALGSNRIRFYQGLHYRHLLVIDDASAEINCWPPHDNLGKHVDELRVTSKNDKAKETAELLNKLVSKSKDVLADIAQNKSKKKQGEKRPNLIWPWAQGEKPKMRSIKELTGLSGAVITAVDLIKGLGKYAGMDVINVEGATGNWKTNYENKARAALKALDTYDYVYLHVEAADEAAHDGDLDLKIRVIEDLDSRLVATILKGLEKRNGPLRIALLPDHPTPVEKRCHVHDPVPFLLWGAGIHPDATNVFDEVEAKRGAFGCVDQKGFFHHYLER